MRIYPQEDHADLGLVDDDHTEQLVKEIALGRCVNTAEGSEHTTSH